MISGSVLLVFGLSGVRSSIGIVDTLAFVFALGIGPCSCTALVDPDDRRVLDRPHEHVLELFEGILHRWDVGRGRLPGMAALQSERSWCRLPSRDGSGASTDVEAPLRRRSPSRSALRLCCSRSTAGLALGLRHYSGASASAE